MRIIRDYQCLCGHTFEAPSDSTYVFSMDMAFCTMCHRAARAVLSATPTTFKFADASARKHRQ